MHATNDEWRAAQQLQPARGKQQRVRQGRHAQGPKSFAQGLSGTKTGVVKLVSKDVLDNMSDFSR